MPMGEYPALDGIRTAPVREKPLLLVGMKARPEGVWIGVANGIKLLGTSGALPLLTFMDPIASDKPDESGVWGVGGTAFDVRERVALLAA
jgi:hypothetical protein